LQGTANMNAAFSRWLESHGNRLSCRALGARYQCATPQGLDVGGVLIINGAAACTPDAPAQYQAAQLQARQARRGMWAH
jgi:endonuclease YncB( thermonuclease family)